MIDVANHVTTLLGSVAGGPFSPLRLLSFALIGVAINACATRPPTPIAQVRFARPTHDLDRVLAFYRDGLGLPVLGGFEGHEGYDGAMVGLPGADRHLEFTYDGGRHPLTPPGPENLLVFYYSSVSERDAVVARLAQMGHAAVPPENPYWVGKAITVPDPDGYRVVLFGGTWEPEADEVPARFRSRPR